MALAGRASEFLTFNHVSTSTQVDLRKVTKFAYAQIREHGTDPVVGPISLKIPRVINFWVNHTPKN